MENSSRSRSGDLGDGGGWSWWLLRNRPVNTGGVGGDGLGQAATGSRLKRLEKLIGRRRFWTTTDVPIRPANRAKRSRRNRQQRRLISDTWWQDGSLVCGRLSRLKLADYVAAHQDASGRRCAQRSPMPDGATTPLPASGGRFESSVVRDLPPTAGDLCQRAIARAMTGPRWEGVVGDTSPRAAGRSRSCRSTSISPQPHGRPGRHAAARFAAQELTDRRSWPARRHLTT